MMSTNNQSEHGAEIRAEIHRPELYVSNKRSKSSEGEGEGRSKRKKVQEQASGDGRMGEAENYCEYCDCAEDHGTSRHVKHLPPKLANYIGRILEEGKRTRRNPRTRRYNHSLSRGDREEGIGNVRVLVVEHAF